MRGGSASRAYAALFFLVPRLLFLLLFERSPAMAGKRAQEGAPKKRSRNKAAPARIVSLLEFGQVVRRSVNSVRDFIRDHSDFPAISKGKNGVAYEIDLDLAIAWWRAHHDAEDAKAQPRVNPSQGPAAERAAPMSPIGGRADNIFGRPDVCL